VTILVGAGAALWLGILTSISPCPLATNIVAISFIAKRVGHARQVFLAGLLYTAGRALTYLALGVVVIASVLAIPEVSNFLQRYMNRALGPILIIVGMVLLDLLRLRTPGRGVSARMQRFVEHAGVWGAGPLGVVFALSFCPVSAGLFFGSLIPLSVRHGSRVLLPSLYGVGTALPVLFFAILIAVSTQSVARAFNKLAVVERWARRITGALFILAGVYYCLKYIFEVL